MDADEVVERIVALRKLTEATGCITRRTQSELLSSLPPELLTEVAVKLQRLTKETEANETRTRR